MTELKNADAPISEAQRTKHFWSKISTFRALGYRDYRYLWFTQVASSSAQWMEQTARGLLIYQMTGSAVALGLVNLFRAGPMLVFGLLAGVVADRVDRKKLLIFTKLSMALFSLITAVLITTGLVRPWNIYLIAFLQGWVSAFEQPSRQSLIPHLVDRKDLVNAVALNSTAMNTTRIVGPSLAGMLIAVVGMSGSYYVQALAFGLSALVVSRIRAPHVDSATRDESILKNIKGGISYVMSNGVIATLLALALVPMIFAQPFRNFMPIFSEDVLKVGSVGLGLMLSAPGIGSLVGAVIIASLGDFKAKGKVLLGGAMAFGATIVLFAVSTNFPLVLIFLAFTGAANTAYMAVNNSLLQTHTEDSFRGRVMSIYLLDRGLVPLGTMIASGLIEVLGPQAGVTIMGSITLFLAVGVALRFKHIRELS